MSAPAPWPPEPLAPPIAVPVLAAAGSPGAWPAALALLAELSAAAGIAQARASNRPRADDLMKRSFLMELSLQESGRRAP
jgi:hypothetical protein